jgi:hypothetical protein
MILSLTVVKTDLRLRRFAMQLGARQKFPSTASGKIDPTLRFPARRAIRSSNFMR